MAVRQCRGLVTKNPENRTRFLVLSPLGYKETEEEGYMAAAKAVRSKNRTHLGYYEIILNEDGFLKSYQYSEKNRKMIKIYGRHT